VDGEAEDLDAVESGLVDGLAGILDAGASFVLVEVVGFPVGHEQQHGGADRSSGIPGSWRAA